MFFFDRSKVGTPKWFGDKVVQRELKRVADYLITSDEERSQTTLPTVWKTPIHPEVLKFLQGASGGKCAFCEEKTEDLKPYRFRPPGYAEPSRDRLEKACYIWHAFDWGNFFPICDDCLPPNKQNYFPVFGLRNFVRYIQTPDIKEGFHYASGIMLDIEAPEPTKGHRALVDLLNEGDVLKVLADAEEPRLIAPGSIGSPSRYFAAKFSGELVPIAARAKLTIDHFNLNSLQNVMARGEQLTEYVDRLLTASNSSRWNEQLASLFHFHELEFASAWYLILRRLGERIAQHVQFNSSLSAKNIEKAFQRFHKDGALDKLSIYVAQYRRMDGAADRPFVQQPRSSAESVPADIPRAIRTLFPAAVSKISIRNFKALEQIDLTMPEPKTAGEDDYSSDRPSTPALLILGENATGKSTILEAITLALIDDDAFGELDLSAKRMVLNPEYMGSSIEPEQLEAPTRSDVKITLKDNSRYELKVNGKTGTFVRRNKAGKGKFRRSLAAEQASLVFAYGAHRLFGKSSKTRQHVSNVITLFENDVLTINPEKWMVELAERDPHALDDVVAALREIIQIDGSFETISVQDDPLETGKKHCVIRLKRTRQVEHDGEKRLDMYTVPIRLDSVSSGYRVLIALVCDIISGLMEATGTKNVAEAKDTPCLVLIDEIEAHLHPRWKMQVIGGLRKALPKATFIMTSHDPLCLRGMLDGEVQVLNRFLNSGEETNSKLNEVVESVPGLKNAEQFTVEQLLTSDLFQLFTTDDPQIERAFAEMGDAVSQGAGADDPSSKEAFEKMRKDIRDALPVGDSETVRLVQEVVVQYLANRRSLRDEQARVKAKQEILDILNGRPV